MFGMLGASSNSWTESLGFFGGYSGREGCCFGIVVKDGHNEK